MSEYQYYEFLAVDRPLNDRQRDEVRSLSTRARITATSFVNEYEWGNFRGDPNRMMERYYDAHLYVTNWGTRRVMFRLPRRLLDINVAEDYCVVDQAVAWTAGDFLLLDLTSEDESGEWDETAETTLSAVVGVRTELAAGDLRPLYLAWLAGYGVWVRDEDAFDLDVDDDLEPPVPPGLATLTAAQRSLADFLRLDDCLLSIAAQASPPLDETSDDPGQLAAWVTGLPLAEKNRLLLRVVEDDAVAVRMEMLHRYRDEHATSVPVPSRRTVGELLNATAQRRAGREHQAAAERAAEEARREKARAFARERRLNELAGDEDAAWSRIDEMIATRKPGEYDTAVALLTDLKALAERDGHHGSFIRRSTALRQTHARKPSLIARLNRAGV
ncbi:hypothetical protein [Streptomyces mayteni]